MDIDRRRGGDRTYYISRKQSYMAKNYWQKKEREERVVKTLQELTEDNRGQ